MVNEGNQILVADTNGRLFHTIRYTDGAWEGFGDVKSQAGDRGSFKDIAGANVVGELQSIGVTNDGKLWHTIRHANGAWEGFGDVKSQAGDRGSFINIAVANVNEELQVSGVTSGGGGLWHTIRHANGAWEGFGDVKSQAGNHGTFKGVAVTGSGGELHLVGLTTDGKLWHTIRHANGAWDHFVDVKAQAGNPGAFTSVGITFADGRRWSDNIKRVASIPGA